MVRIAPTHAQQNVLEAIRAWHDDHGYPPAVRDLAAALDLSASTIQYHLNRLDGDGWIERDPNVARSIRVRDNGPGERSLYDPCTVELHLDPAPGDDGQPGSPDHDDLPGLPADPVLPG